MTWTKLSDDFSDDCWTLSDAAFRLHVEGLVWNSRKLLDLHLSREDVRRFAKHPEAVTELVDGGWWRETEDGYVIQHHGSYQRTREAVLKQQAANEENGRKGGRPCKPGRERPPQPAQRDTRSLSESVSERVTESVAAVPADQGATDHPRAHGNPVANRKGQDRTGQDRSYKGTTHLQVGTLPQRECGWCHQPFVPQRPTQCAHEVCPA